MLIYGIVTGVKICYCDSTNVAKQKTPQLYGESDPHPMEAPHPSDIRNSIALELLLLKPQGQGTAKGKMAKAACLLQDPNDPLPVPGMGGFQKASSQTG